MIEVSIHAPAKGATQAVLDGKIEGLFQSTRPRRARPAGFGIYIVTLGSFNPRAREGRDIHHYHQTITHL